MRVSSRSGLLAAALGATAFIALLAFGANTASAQNKCLSGKTKCVDKKMAGLLGCHSKAEKAGTVPDATCLSKVYAKFDGGTKGTEASCFRKLEIKNDGPCVTTGDRVAQETKVDAFVLDVVQELDPSYPTPVTNSCSAGKKKCVLKEAKGILGCHEKCQKDPTKCAGVMTTCINKARDKYSGGLDPTKGCFAKLEAKGSCLTTSDSADLEAKVDAFITDVLLELENTTPPTPTPTPTVTITPTPCATSTPGGSCPTQVEVTVTGDATTTDLDIGWTGQEADAHTGSMGRLTLQLAGCAGTEPPCGVCTSSGPLVNAGGVPFNNHRCVGDTAIQCTNDGDCGVDGPCHFFFGAPLPLATGGAFVCVTNDIVQPVTGTVDIEAGTTQTFVPLSSHVYSGPTVDRPCPNCIGGFCDSGKHATEACTVNSQNPTFGDLSFDCPPNPGAILAVLPIPFNLTTGTQTWSLSAGSPGCTAPGYTSSKCFCDTCDNENAEPCWGVGQCSTSCLGGTNNGVTCTDPSECPGGTCAGGQCGGRRCQGGANNGTPCTNGTMCPGGGCGIPGKATAFNECADAVCTPNTPPDTDSSNEGTCAGGPFEQYCGPWAVFTQCVADTNCAPFNRCVGGSNAGALSCTVDSQCPGGVCEIQLCGATPKTAHFRECFTDNGVIGTHCFGGTNDTAPCSAASECPLGFCGGGSVSATGVPFAVCNGSGTGAVVSMFCVGPNSSGSINAVVGTPGLGRATLPTTVVFN